MQYGICNLSIVPLRAESSDTSEMVSQVLYGDFFKVLEKRKSWSKIRLAFDKYEGWIDNKQYLDITKEEYEALQAEKPLLSTDLVEFVKDTNNQLYPIPIGSCLNGLKILNHTHDGNRVQKVFPKENIITTAFLFLNNHFPTNKTLKRFYSCFLMLL